MTLRTFGVLAMLGIVLGSSPARAVGVAEPTLLRDGGAVRTVERLPGAAVNGLSRVRLTDAPTGRAIDGLVGRNALVQLTGEPRAELWTRLAVRPLRAVMPSIGLWLVEDLGDDDGLSLAARLQRDPSFGVDVREAIPDFSLPHRFASIALPPNDPRYPGQWFFARIGMEDAWKIESGQPSVGVVVVDTGCDLKHPDLIAQLDPGRDVLDGDDDPSPTPNENGNAHGTACAGLVAASTDNNLGVAGACPGCRLRCVRLLGPNGTAIAISTDVDAFQFAFDVGAAVVSNSWGFTDATPVPAVLSTAVQNVFDNGRGGLGAVVVFAAGNDDRPIGADELNAVRGVLTVGAVNNFGEVTAFSNSGASVGLVAPIGSLTTDISGPDGDSPDDYTASFGGTSSACPIVAGVAGLLASAAPDKHASELEAALTMTAKQSPFAKPDAGGHDLFYGFGEIVPAAALRLVAPAVAPPPPMNASGCSCQLAAPATPPTSAWLLIAVLLSCALLRRRHVP